MSNGDGGSNTILYVVGGVALLGVGGLCCLGSAGAFFWMRARDVDDTPPYVQRPVEEPETFDQPLIGGGAGEVSLAPPPSLMLNPLPTSDRRTRHVEATVTHVEGSVGVSVGDRCSFDVLVLDRSGPPGHFCRTFAECNGVRLFGQEHPRRNGFFPCELYDLPPGVAGEDLETTGPSGIGDPMFQIDSRDSRFLVADDEYGMRMARYRIIARIDSITAQ